MILNAYSDSADGLFGISLVSAGHIFAHSGRRIVRPKGRADWLLFYIANGSEHFIFDKEEVASEGSFVFFRPGEKQEHFCTDWCLDWEQKKQHDLLQLLKGCKHKKSVL